MNHKSKRSVIQIKSRQKDQKKPPTKVFRDRKNNPMQKITRQSLKLVHMSKHYDFQNKQRKIIEDWNSSDSIQKNIQKAFDTPHRKNAIARVGFLLYLEHQSKIGDMALLETILQNMTLRMNTSQNPSIFFNDFKELLNIYLRNPKTKGSYDDTETFSKLKSIDIRSIRINPAKKIIQHELFLWLRQYFEGDQKAYNEALKLLKQAEAA